MLTKTIDVTEVQMNLKELLALLQEDTEIVLTEGNTPLARLTTINPSSSLPPRIPDLHPNAIIINENSLTPQPGLHPGAISISDDFNDPLPDEFWLGQEWNYY